MRYISLKIKLIGLHANVYAWCPIKIGTQLNQWKVEIFYRTPTNRACKNILKENLPPAKRSPSDPPPFSFLRVL